MAGRWKSFLVTPFLFVSTVTDEPTVEKNGGPLLLSLATEPNGIGQVTDGGDGEREEEHVDAAVLNEVVEKVVEQEEEKKSKEEKVSRFGKLFKMKPHVKKVAKEESPGESPAGEEEPQQVSASHFCSFFFL